eukprot:CAMPEP_0182523802 /NCGR_PEP_ID=MMETSP1323-20130603/1324_1 /TAXON_ID=236787 /ORGANISM="Florenciella parvula, Strain RCC1693" /LENGTH=57 /DNA_ID=CAMNT_0024732245 /DNA_START=216 /DNA_END=387 /DNA_ORIENTATION=-
MGMMGGRARPTCLVNPDDDVTIVCLFRHHEAQLAGHDLRHRSRDGKVVRAEDLEEPP